MDKRKLNDRLLFLRKIPHKIRLGLALRRPVSAERIRRDLAIAQAYGLDPHQLYAECLEENVGTNGNVKQALPPYVEVDPSPAESVSLRAAEQLP